MTLGRFQKQIKYIFLVSISILVFVVTIFLGKNASLYFARAVGCPAKNVRPEKVAPNSAVIVWDTDGRTQGRVEYGTNASNLVFTQPEAAPETKHNVPLTLLTPNTIYYYLIAIGDNKCDTTGQKCDGNCIPFSFTTSTLVVEPTEVDEKEKPTPTRGAVTVTPRIATRSAAPTSSLSLFCKAVQANIGKNEKVATEWASLKTYDIDGNGIINGLDVIKCQKSGR